MPGRQPRTGRPPRAIASFASSPRSDMSMPRVCGSGRCRVVLTMPSRDVIDHRTAEESSDSHPLCQPSVRIDVTGLGGPERNSMMKHSDLIRPDRNLECETRRHSTRRIRDPCRKRSCGRRWASSAMHFLRLNEEDFHGIVAQSRRTVARFARTVFDAVLRYEFLLPLTNERKLRAELDEIFYRDHLMQRANEIGLATLTSASPNRRERPLARRSRCCLRSRARRCRGSEKLEDLARSLGVRVHPLAALSASGRSGSACACGAGTCRRAGRGMRCRARSRGRRRGRARSGWRRSTP